MATKELAKPNPKGIALAYKAILDGEQIPFEGDPQAVSRAIVERIMAAETFEDAFKPQELDAWRNHLDRVVLVRDFHLNPTTFENENGASVYAVCDLVDPVTGEEFTVTCGGRNVMTQLVKMHERGWQDKPVKLTGKKTAEGYQALWLVAA